MKIVIKSLMSLFLERGGKPQLTGVSEEFESLLFKKKERIPRPPGDKRLG